METILELVDRDKAGPAQHSSHNSHSLPGPLGHRRLSNLHIFDHEPERHTAVRRRLKEPRDTTSTQNVGKHGSHVLRETATPKPEQRREKVRPVLPEPPGSSTCGERRER
ncbi:hypothetical protein [Pyrodictium abyssi]|uniref:Uncharacterized protein n=1 Tax=Pyrodictium abyssi TaxID=54256 RepID=A0ABN6ZN80_9CREN|nr:hypothetical protein PABY_12870 [Pyrodictium abyssi]